MATNWRKIVARCKFLVASLYNVNDTAPSMEPPIRFDCLKKSHTEVNINYYYLEVNWPWLCDLANETFVLTLNLNLNHRKNLVTNVATKQEFLVAKEKMLVARVTVSVTISSPDLYKFVGTKKSLPGNRIQMASLKWSQLH